MFKFHFIVKGSGRGNRVGGGNYSSQPQTVARKWAMLTRLLRISIIQGCSSMRQGDARRTGALSRLFWVNLLEFLVLLERVCGNGDEDGRT